MKFLRDFWNIKLINADIALSNHWSCSRTNARNIDKNINLLVNKVLSEKREKKVYFRHILNMFY